MKTFLLSVVLVGLASCVPFNEDQQVDYIEDATEADGDDGWRRVITTRGDGGPKGEVLDEDVAFIRKLKKGWGFSEESLKAKPTAPSKPDDEDEKPKLEFDSGSEAGSDSDKEAES